METFRSCWIKSTLIFHHWITNLTVGCIYKYMGEIWVIRSSKIQIWPSDQISKFSKKEPKESPIFFKEKKIDDLSEKSVIFRRFFEILFRLLRVSLHLRFYHWFIYLELIYRRYLSDFLDIFLIFLLFDNQCSILFRGHPISNILTKSSIKTDFSIHDSTTSLLSINTPMFESQGTHCDGDAFIPTINYRQSKYLIIQAYREMLWYTPRGLLLLFLNRQLLIPLHVIPLMLCT